ncbi:MAG: hypothetical protein KatS3mg051_0411 [Anaerolineae bacterium]|nr:MAG: hypothetical protein KatS3mg051_0411 [Anaerolineae bacterium]
MLEALARPLDGAQAVTTATGTRRRRRPCVGLLTEAQVSLVVLDDVWDGTALSQVLKAVPRQVPVLVTARQRYALDHIIEVGKLEAGDALQLLSQHAGQPCDDDAARELCRQVGYHPFALEIAGKTLKVDRIRPADLLRRIAAAPHALAMPEDFAEEGRTSISELLTASLYALDEATREVFLAFGALFAPQATSALLARYMGRDEGSIREALITLGRRGLADRLQEAATDFACYRVHDLAHSYARAVLTGRGADPLAVIAACRAYAVEHEQNLAALDAEINNLLGAADAARQHNQPDALIAIVQALAGPYLTARGTYAAFPGAAGCGHRGSRTPGAGSRRSAALSAGQARQCLLRPRRSTPSPATLSAGPRPGAHAGAAGSSGVVAVCRRQGAGRSAGRPRSSPFPDSL